MCLVACHHPQRRCCVSGDCVSCRVSGRSQCVLCGQADRSPSPGQHVGTTTLVAAQPGRTFGKSQGLKFAAQVPDCKAVPVSPVIRSHDTIPGSPHCVLLLLFLNIVGREVDVEREFREGSGVVKCAPANCSGSRPRIGRGLCRNTWRLSGQQREARPFRDVSTCPHLPPLAGK